jgi:hypothetical protein
MQTPSTRWVPSPRRYDPHPPQWCYPEDAEVKQLGSQGQLKLDGQRWEISKALARERVRLVRITRSHPGLLLQLSTQGD